MWYGGSGYGPSDPVEHLEEFDSIAAAKSALWSRRDYGYSYLQEFNYVNRENERVYCPCVEDDSTMWLYFAADTDPYTGDVYVTDNGPDRILFFGARGAVREDQYC